MRYGFSLKAVAAIACVLVTIVWLGTANRVICPISPAVKDLPGSHCSGCPSSECSGTAQDTESDKPFQPNHANGPPVPLQAGGCEDDLCIVCHSPLMLSHAGEIRINQADYTPLLDSLERPVDRAFPSGLYRPPRS